MTELKAQKREVLGRKVRGLRKNGLIPAELYGHGLENIHLSIPANEFSRVYKEAGESSVINVDIGGDTRPALIRNVHINPVTDEILSVDFYQIRMDEKVTTHVPIEFEGESPAVKDLDGILVKSLEEIEVEALPMDIPEKVIVDLSLLREFDQTIYVKDISKSEKFDFLADPETAIVSVTAPREEEKEEVEEEISPEEVKVEGEEKRADKETEEEKIESGETDQEKDQKKQ